MTSRWAVEVTGKRGVPVRWRAYSLAIKNEGVEIPERYRAFQETTHAALRVVEAVWAEHGDEPIGRLYTEIGTRFHLQGDKSLEAVAAALEAAGLDRGLVSAADDAAWDAEIRGSMADATTYVGEDVGVPIMVLTDDGGRTAGTSGPIMSPSATGEEALAMWDAVNALVFAPCFFELKRSRTTGPQLG